MEKKVMLMSDYTVYCTSEQTNKALELGAPIRFEMEHPLNFETLEKSPYPDIKVGKDGEPILITPTAEQMINWLEEQPPIRSVIIELGVFDKWYHSIYDTDDVDISGMNLFSSRKEATLAAIDAALDYLIKNK